MGIFYFFIFILVFFLAKMQLSFCDFVGSMMVFFFFFSFFFFSLIPLELAFGTNPIVYIYILSSRYSIGTFLVTSMFFVSVGALDVDATCTV